MGDLLGLFCLTGSLKGPLTEIRLFIHTCMSHVIRTGIEFSRKKKDSDMLFKGTGHILVILKDQSSHLVYLNIYYA